MVSPTDCFAGALAIEENMVAAPQCHMAQEDSKSCMEVPPAFVENVYFVGQVHNGSYPN
jgi:hypothetical protein